MSEEISVADEGEQEIFEGDLEAEDEVEAEEDEAEAEGDEVDAEDAEEEEREAEAVAEVVVAEAMAEAVIEAVAEAVVAEAIAEAVVEAEEEEEEKSEGEQVPAINQAREAGNEAAERLIAQGLVEEDEGDDQRLFTRVEVGSPAFDADFTQEDEDALTELEQVLTAQSEAQRTRAEILAAQQAIEDAIRQQRQLYARAGARVLRPNAVNTDAVDSFMSAARGFQRRDNNNAEAPPLSRPPTPYPRSRAPPAPKGRSLLFSL